MLKCHKGLELDTIPEFDLGEKTESSEALNCVPTVERSSSRNFARLSRRALFFQSPPVFCGGAARLPPSSVAMPESQGCNLTVTFPGHRLCRSDAWSGLMTSNE